MHPVPHHVKGNEGRNFLVHTAALGHGVFVKPTWMASKVTRNAGCVALVKPSHALGDSVGSNVGRHAKKPARESFAASQSWRQRRTGVLSLTGHAGTVSPTVLHIADGNLRKIRPSRILL